MTRRLPGPLEWHKLTTKENAYTIKSENDRLNKKVPSSRQKVVIDSAETVSCGKLFQIFAAATRNALLPTVGYEQSILTTASLLIM